MNWIYTVAVHVAVSSIHITSCAFARPTDQHSTAFSLHPHLHQSLRKGCNAACMRNLSLYFYIRGQSGIYEYILMCWNPHVLAQKLGNRHFPGGSWPLDWTQRQVDRLSTLDQWGSCRPGWITRNFFQSCDFPDVTVCMSDGTFVPHFEFHNPKICSEFHFFSCNFQREWLGPETLGLVMCLK